MVYDSGRTSAQLTIKCRKAQDSTTLAYKFGDGDWQSSNEYSASSSSDTGVMKVEVSDSSDNSKKITL